MFKPIHKDGKTVKTLYIETMPLQPEPPPDPNRRVIKLWKWDDFRGYNVTAGIHDPWIATDLYLRGYYTAKARAVEIKSVIDWLLEHDTPAPNSVTETTSDFQSCAPSAWAQSTCTTPVSGLPTPVSALASESTQDDKSHLPWNPRSTEQINAAIEEFNSDPLTKYLK